MTTSLDLEPIKARIEIVQMVPPGPGESPTPMDMLARDVDALIAEVERLQGRVVAYKVAFRRLGACIRAARQVTAVMAHMPPGEVRAVVLMPGWLQHIIGAEMALILDENKAVNYVDFTCGLRGKEYILTVQRKEGRTPHELRREAEAEVERLRAQLQAIQEGYCE